jgi:cell division septation protein DedD
MPLIGDKLMNTSPDNYSSPANHNLSSVLSQIQDNGPAYAESANQGNLRSFISKTKTKRATAAPQQQDDEQYPDDKLSLSSNNLQQESPAHSTNPRITKKAISHGIWLQLLLLLISAALLASTLFRLDAQTNNVEDSLSSFDDKIQESVDFQKQHSTDGATKINAALQALQKEFQLIKTDYSALDKKYVALVKNKTAATTRSKSATNDDASIIKYEILSLKSELQAVKNKLNISGNAHGSTTDRSPDNSLTVALASLTNKTKADKIVQQLYAEGLFPTIKQAIVKGERVYRLSVSGFIDRDEAEAFIRKAGKRYGMKDSRIRRS